MPHKAAPPASPRSARNTKHDGTHAPHDGLQRELVIITGLSGSGKASALKAFEDLGYYSVDNLPLDLVPAFADLVRQSAEIQRAALVVDVREGQRLDQFPKLLNKLRKMLPTQVFFLEASDAVLLRRFSETRRPHPLGRTETVVHAIDAERRLLDPIRKMADETVDTSQHNVHELRAFVLSKFARGSSDTSAKNLMVSFVSFGYKNGVPLEADLVFDVRFLPNPHFIPEFRPLTGKHPKVAQYIRQFPQTEEFLDKTTDLLLFLLPHYVKEGKSYLTVGFGCTGGQHRSVMIAEEIRKRLAKAGYRVKSTHRDMPR
jgi:RNase adapter protein RapZ